MKKCMAQKAYLVVMLVLSVFISSLPGYARAAASPFDLGAATTFAGFGGGAGMTNEGTFTVVNGDIGTTGAASLVTGFHDTGATVYTETTLNIGVVNGTIHTATTPLGSVQGEIAAAVALSAKTAFDNLSPAALPGGIDVSSLGGAADELGNRTLSPGVYKSAPGEFYIQGGDLYLDAQGDPNAVWVFQMSSTLTVGGPGAAFPQSVKLINGAQAKNVFWQVGSFATINAGGGGAMVGTIISYAGVAFSTAGNVALVTLEGRALALHASVTLVNTVINVPAQSQPALWSPDWLYVPVASGAVNTLNWAGYNFPGVSYVLEQSNDPGFATSTVVYSGPNTSIILSGYADGTYYYRLNATVAGYATSQWRAGTSAWHVISNVSLWSPDWLYVPVTTSGTNTLNWSGFNVLGIYYVLEQSNDPAFATSTVVYSGPNTSITLSGFSTGSYYYRLSAAAPGFITSPWRAGTSTWNVL